MMQTLTYGTKHRWSNHAEEERGILDKDIDLGSSEYAPRHLWYFPWESFDLIWGFLTCEGYRWIGRTSLMLIPIMSHGYESRGGDNHDRVVGIIMVASTERIYSAGCVSNISLLPYSPFLLSCFLPITFPPAADKQLPLQYTEKCWWLWQVIFDQLSSRF